MRSNLLSPRLSPVLGSLVLALTLTACPPPPATQDAGPTDECEIPRDCGAGSDCVLGEDGLRHCIKLFCTEDADCNVAAGEHCDLRRGICMGDTCHENNQCQGGQVCLGGTCQAAPAGADSCEITPGTAVVRASNTVTLGVTGLLTSGALAPLATFTWSSSDESCATVSDGVVSGTGSSTCTATITATPVGDGAACTASVTNFPTVSLPELRVLVLDEMSGSPVQGATLLVRTDDGAGGTITEQSTVDTDANGVASVNDIGVSTTGSILDVSIFDADYMYVTVVRPGTNDLVFPLRKLADPTKMSGVKGTFDFSATHTRGDISLGIGGMSIAGSLTDLDFMVLLGETVPRDIVLEGVGEFPDTPLPSGLYLKVGAADIKADFQAFGEPGKRIFWGLGGKVGLSEIGPIISQVAGDSGGLDVGGILASVLPYFSTFDHAVVGNINLPLVARPTTGEPKDWDFGTDDLTVKLDTLLSQSATYAMPTMPHNPGRNTFIDGVIMLMGSVVPGQGTVPLGLTAGLDAPEDSDVADGVIDPPPCPESNQGCVRSNRGEVIIDFAPPHNGLEGTPFMAMAMALGLSAIGEAQFTSVLFEISDGINASGTNSFSAGSFLDFAQDATYVQGVSYQQTGTTSGADFYRLNLDTDDQGWQIYFDDPQAGLTLPTPPSGMSARTTNADIQVFKTAAAGSFGVSELFEFNGTNLSDLLLLTSAFSTMECVKIEQPTPANACADGYTANNDTGFCEGGPDEITSFAAGTANPCQGMSGYEAVLSSGDGSAGICARIPSCRQQLP